MKVTPVYRTEREHWGASSILRRFNDGVYKYTCSIRYDEYKYKTKHAFFYDSQFLSLYQSKCCGDIIDNRVDAPICVLVDNYRYWWNVEYVYKITPW